MIYQPPGSGKHRRWGMCVDGTHPGNLANLKKPLATTLAWDALLHSYTMMNHPEGDTIWIFSIFFPLQWGFLEIFYRLSTPGWLYLSISIDSTRMHQVPYWLWRCVTIIDNLGEVLQWSLCWKHLKHGLNAINTWDFLLGVYPSGKITVCHFSPRHFKNGGPSYLFLAIFKS